MLEIPPSWGAQDSHTVHIRGWKVMCPDKIVPIYVNNYLLIYLCGRLVFPITLNLNVSYFFGIVLIGES